MVPAHLVHLYVPRPLDKDLFVSEYHIRDDQIIPGPRYFSSDFLAKQAVRWDRDRRDVAEVMETKHCIEGPLRRGATFATHSAELAKRQLDNDITNENRKLSMRPPEAILQEFLYSTPLGDDPNADAGNNVITQNTVVEPWSEVHREEFDYYLSMLYHIYERETDPEKKAALLSSYRSAMDNSTYSGIDPVTLRPVPVQRDPHASLYGGLTGVNTTEPLVQQMQHDLSTRNVMTYFENLDKIGPSAMYFSSIYSLILWGNASSVYVPGTHEQRLEESALSLRRSQQSEFNNRLIETGRGIRIIPGGASAANLAAIAEQSKRIYDKIIPQVATVEDEALGPIADELKTMRKLPRTKRLAERGTINGIVARLRNRAQAKTGLMRGLQNGLAQLHKRQEQELERMYRREVAPISPSEFFRSLLGERVEGTFQQSVLIEKLRKAREDYLRQLDSQERSFEQKIATLQPKIADEQSKKIKKVLTTQLQTAQLERELIKSKREQALEQNSFIDKHGNAIVINPSFRQADRPWDAPRPWFAPGGNDLAILERIFQGETVFVKREVTKQPDGSVAVAHSLTTEAEWKHERDQQAASLLRRLNRERRPEYAVRLHKTIEELSASEATLELEVQPGTRQMIFRAGPSVGVREMYSSDGKDTPKILLEPSEKGSDIQLIAPQASMIPFFSLLLIGTILGARRRVQHPHTFALPYETVEEPTFVNPSEWFVNVRNADSEAHVHAKEFAQKTGLISSEDLYVMLRHLTQNVGHLGSDKIMMITLQIKEVLDRRWLRIVAIDNGPGFQASIDQSLAIGFTTKPRNSLSGAGLTYIRNIVLKGSPLNRLSISTNQERAVYVGNGAHVSTQLSEQRQGTRIVLYYELPSEFLRHDGLVEPGNFLNAYKKLYHRQPSVEDVNLYYGVAGLPQRFTRNERKEHFHKNDSPLWQAVTTRASRKREHVKSDHARVSPVLADPMDELIRSVHALIDLSLHTALPDNWTEIVTDIPLAEIERSAEKFELSLEGVLSTWVRSLPPTIIRVTHNTQFMALTEQIADIAAPVLERTLEETRSSPLVDKKGKLLLDHHSSTLPLSLRKLSPRSEFDKFATTLLSLESPAKESEPSYTDDVLSPEELADRTLQTLRLLANNKPLSEKERVDVVDTINMIWSGTEVSLQLERSDVGVLRHIHPRLSLIAGLKERMLDDTAFAEHIFRKTLPLSESRMLLTQAVVGNETAFPLGHHLVEHAATTNSATIVPLRADQWAALSMQKKTERLLAILRAHHHDARGNKKGTVILALDNDHMRDDVLEMARNMDPEIFQVVVTPGLFAREHDRWMLELPTLESQLRAAPQHVDVNSFSTLQLMVPHDTALSYEYGNETLRGDSLLRQATVLWINDVLESVQLKPGDVDQIERTAQLISKNA